MSHSALKLLLLLLILPAPGMAADWIDSGMRRGIPSEDWGSVVTVYRDADAIGAFTEAMDDDLGTPEGVATMFETIRRANAAIDSGDATAASLVATAIDLAGAMGLTVASDEPAGDDDAEIDALVAARTEARGTKDFAEADRLRDELTARGIVVEDTPNGPVWRRA